MKKLLQFLAVGCLLTSCCTSKFPIKPFKERTLGDMVKAVQSQYELAQQKLLAKGIKIDIAEADLTAKLSSVSNESADVTVWIVKPSTKFIQTKTTSVTYTLTKDTSKAGGAKENLVTDNTLCDLIVDAATKFANLDTTIGKLTKDNFSLDIVFAIENDSSATFTFKVFGLGADAAYEIDNSAQHELVLKFTPSK